MPTRRSFFLSLANLLVMVALGSLLAFSLHAQGQSRGWEDDFNSGRLDNAAGTSPADGRPATAPTTISATTNRKT